MDNKKSFYKLNFAYYDKSNIEQKVFLNDIYRDRDISKYISDIVSDLSNKSGKNIGFIVKDEDIEEYIGLCVIKPALYDVTAAPIEYAVHHKYRNSNKKYGSSILSTLTDLLFDNNIYSKIVLEINANNIASIKAALRSGFQIDYELAEIFNYEGYHYIPYTKNNPNYKNNNSPTKRLN